MTTLLRVLVGIVSIGALIPLVGGFVFLIIMAHGFGYHASDVAGGAGMLLGVIYFVAALITCFPRFPAVALGRFGLVLHLLIMPASVALVCVGLGSRGAIYLIPGAVFAALWFIMARSVAHSIA